MDYFVAKSLSAHGKREPLIHAIGGFPAALESSLDALVNSFTQNGVKPLFVLRGLRLISPEPPFSTPDSKLVQRSQAWSVYERGQGEQAVMNFDEVDIYDLHSGKGTRTLVGLLQKKNLDFMVAPYTSSAQLAYMLENEFIDAVFASNDCLLYGVERLITSIDTRNGNFQWIGRRAVLNELGFTQDKFIEAAIAAGCDLNKVTFPPVDHMINSQQMAPVTALRAIQDLTNAHGSMYAAIVAFPDPNRTLSYAERFRKAVAAAMYQPVLKEDGRVEPNDSSDIPNDIHEFIGQRMPDEIMFYLSRGLIGPELLNALTDSIYTEDAPLDGGESRQYRDFIVKLHGLRSKALSLVAQTVHRYFQSKQTKAVFWFDPSRTHNFDRVTPPLYTKINSWRVTDKMLGEGTGLDIKSLVKALSDKEFVAKTSTKPDTIPVLKSDREILASTAFRALQVAGFIKEDHNLSATGEALLAGLNQSKSGDSRVPEALVIAFSLALGGHLDGESFTPPISGGPTSIESTDIRKHVLLLSRVATLINLQHKPTGFAGPLSRSLLAFQSFVTAETITYRWLFEACLVSLLCNENADRLARTEDSEWSKLGTSMPFASIPNAGTGISMKTYLEEVAEPSVGKAACTRARETVSQAFKQAVDVCGDLDVAFDLWDSLLVSVNKAKELGVLQDVKRFTEADQWLSTRR